MGNRDMELTTERLRVRPLTLPEFALLLDGEGRLDAALGLEPGPDLDEETRIAMTGLYEEAKQNPAAHLFLTNWQIIARDLNAAVGSACFRGAPNENGEVEIGYGLHPEYRGSGYMAEAVAALCAWALSQPDVGTVVADTEKDNPASHSVLRKCGMVMAGENGTLWRWRLER